MKALDVEHESFLLMQVGACRAGLPLENVTEVTPSLTTESLSGAPAFVKGVAIIRSAAVPVIDLSMIMGIERHGESGRFVLLRLGNRSVAVAVESVIGIVRLECQMLPQVPPLLRDAPGTLLEAMGELDGELLVVLRVGRLIPDELCDSLLKQGAA